MKKVTIRDVAQAANLSIATVSRVLSGKPNVSKETRQQIAAAIRQTNYRISPEMDRSLLAEDGLVYFIMRSASFNTYSQLLNQQMILAAGSRGLRIVTGNVETRTDSFEEELLDCLNQARRIGVRGVIISGFAENKLPDAVIQALRKLALPVVLINRTISDYSFSRVLTGSERGAFMAASHLLKAGRRHLLMLTYPNHTGKRSGFERAIAEWAGEAIVHQAAETLDDSEESCENALRAAMEKDPLLDGILCSSDEQAARALQFLRRIGKAVPDEIELIGFNDNLAPFLSPPISSVRVPLSQIAETAIELFLDQERSPDAPVKTVMLDPQLMIR